MTSELRLSEQIKQGIKTDWFTILNVLQLDADTSSEQLYHPDPNIGLALKVVVANEAATWSATINITTLDNAGNEITWYTSDAITANGTTLFLIKPGGGTNGLFTIVPFPLPRVFKVKVDYTGTPDTDMADVTIYGCFV